MSKVSQTIREQVRQRASRRCEYCGILEEAQLYPFHVEHIISRRHGGSSSLDNLAWACFDCNVAKGTDVAGYDEETEELAPLFNPREQTWSAHFVMQEGQILGLTPSGRLTVRLLKFNLGGRIAERQALIDANLWEPL